MASIHLMHRLLGLFTLVSLSVSVIPPQNAVGDCEPFLDVLTRVMVNAGASYFADNPRSNNDSFDPNQVFPPTPIQLFKAYYGAGATPRRFKHSILRIFFADPGIRGAEKADRDFIILRENIYKYVMAQSNDLAREKFGVLIYQAVDKLIPNAPLWLGSRCLAEDHVGSAEKIIFIELERIRNQIGEFKYGNFIDVGSGTTLAFAIDDTGSMANEIIGAKRRAKMIIRERQGSLDQPRDFVLVPFNDPTVGPITVTSNANTFTTAIDRLYAHGGGDAPELALRGILLAVENSREGSTVFVITDIDAKDIELQDVLVAQAQQKKIKITFLLTNRVRTTMCRSHDGSPTSLRRCTTESFKKGMELYQYLANSTGGDLLIVSKSDFFSATQVIDRTVRQGVVDIALKVVSGGSQTFRVKIDSSVREVFFQNTGNCNNFQVSYEGRNLVLENPVTVDNLFEGKVVVNNSDGEWVVRVSSSSQCSIKVIGRSTFGFVQTIAKQDGGELKRFEGQPLFSDDIVIILDGYGKAVGSRVTSLSLIAQNTGVVLTTHSIPASEQSANQFRYSPTMKPTVPFFVRVQGVDESGMGFTRLMSTPIQFVHVQLSCPGIENIVFRPGDSVTIPVTVRNNGPSIGSFQLGATDTQRYITTGVSPNLVLVPGNGGVSTANITARAPDTATVGTTSVITFTAKSSTSSSLLYKPCQIVVGQKSRPDVETFAVTTTIRSRFAETVMSSTVYNNADVSREAQYYVILPVNAFITNFTMTIDGVVYSGRIEEKVRAERIYSIARERDLTAGHVAARDHSTSVFQTSTNLAPRKRVIFQLTYQEALQRKRGMYAYEVAFRMVQPVSMFSISVEISETVPLTTVRALGLDTEQTSVAGPIALQGITTVRSLPNTAEVTYRPTPNQQRLISPFGLNGKFVIEYDVLRDTRSQMVIENNYFAHFITSNLPVMSKRVVFLIDVSGSMYGYKIAQVRQAMNTILNGLAERDSFSVIAFNSSVTRWEAPGAGSVLVPATPDNINSAVEFLNSTVVTKGGTDLLQAVEAAIGMFSAATGEVSNIAADSIVLLTDGRPTDGTIESTSITSTIQELNRGRFGIHTIGFGTLVDMPLLTKIAAQNFGTSTQIFIDLNAYAQISNFFETISQPILARPSLNYTENKVARYCPILSDSLMQNGELVTAGTIFPEFVVPQTRKAVTFNTVAFDDFGDTRRGTVIENGVVTPSVIDNLDGRNFAERLFNFLKLKGVLAEMRGTTNRTRETELRQLALNQSLELGFVTPGITSMVVLKPEDIREIENALAAERATTVAPATTTVPATDDVLGRLGTTTPAPSTFGPDRGFVGDPHVIVSLGLQITVCFNWLGRENEVYNLLEDVDNGITVNGRLAQTPASVTDTSSPTFVSDIGITLSRQHIAIEMDSFRLTLRVGTNKPLRLALRNRFKVKKRGVWFENNPVSDTRFELLITVARNIQFKVVSHVHSPNPNIINHLDFSVTRGRGLSFATSGVLGQFPHESERLPATVDFIENTNQALLWFRHSMIKVTNHVMYDALKQRQIECWWVKNPMDLTGQSKQHYKVSGLLVSPTSAPK